MDKNVLLVFCFLTASLQSVAMEVVHQNPFDLMTDDTIIGQIADKLDDRARGCFRCCCKRFSNAAWPSKKSFRVTLEKKATEQEDHYWQRVWDQLHRLNEKIQTLHGQNDIILRLPKSNGGLLLPPALALINNLNGLSMGYSLSRNDVYRQAQFINLEGLLMFLPYLNFLSLPWGQKERLPFGIRRLTRLQSLNIKEYEFTSDDFALLPSSITDLRLHYCTIWGVPQDAEKLTSLRYLSLIQTCYYQDAQIEFAEQPHCIIEEIEDDWDQFLSPFAPSLEKLDLACSDLIALPKCLTSFEKLQEIDLVGNDLKPAALGCLTGLKNLRRVNLGRNSACESQKELVRSMFLPTVTITYENTYATVDCAQV